MSPQTTLLMWLCCTEQAPVSGAGGQISFYKLTLLLLFCSLATSLCDYVKGCRCAPSISEEFHIVYEIKIKTAADSPAQQVKLNVFGFEADGIVDVEVRQQTCHICVLTGCNWVICN